MEQTITCINCPVGCRMTVSLSDTGEFLSVTGNTCPRGAKYAQQECTLPERMITAVIPVAGSETPLSVKTASPVPKKLISSVIDVLARVQVSLPVTIGQIVLPDVLNTGVDIIATRSLS
jgi:CxxC motif-containing protein